MTLTMEQARASLASKLGGDARPALSTDVLDELLTTYAMADWYNRWPSDPEWEPTYALNAAAAEGWRRKAALVAADFNFTADGASYSKGDVLAQCLQMEAHYAALDNGSLPGHRLTHDYPSRRLWL